MGTVNVLQNCVKHNVRKIILPQLVAVIYGEQKVSPAVEIHPAKINLYGISALKMFCNSAIEMKYGLK